MNVTLPLESMTTAEKLDVMEAIWTDLSRDEQRVESPVWHAEVLREREAAVNEGREVATDWEVAKRRLRSLGA